MLLAIKTRLTTRVTFYIYGEVFGIAVVYRVNNKDMPLVSIQSVSHFKRKSLMTISIAYVIVSNNESTKTYIIWILRVLQKV